MWWEGSGVGGCGGGGGDARRSRRWLLVLCGDGSDSKMLLPGKTVSWEHLFRPVATQHISWDVRFTHRNELLHDPLEPSHPQIASWELISTLRNERRPRLKSLSALPPSDHPPQWKGRNSLKKVNGGSNLYFFNLLFFIFIFYFLFFTFRDQREEKRCEAGDFSLSEGAGEMSGLTRIKPFCGLLRWES